MVNNKIANDIAGLQASRLNNVIDPNPQYTDTTFSKEVTELFDPSCLAYLDSDGRLCVDSVTVSSEIIFNYPFTELMEKGVEEIRIQFTVEGEGSPVFAGFGLGSSTVKDFKSYEIVINNTVNVDETISTLSLMLIWLPQPRPSKKTEMKVLLLEICSTSTMGKRLMPNMTNLRSNGINS